MPCCCVRVLNFCNQNICGNGIEFEATAEIPGVYKMIVSFLNTEFTIEQEVAMSDPLLFPLDQLNENFEFTAEIFDPNGDKVTITKDAVEYDCFKFRTVIRKVLVAVEVES